MEIQKNPIILPESPRPVSFRRCPVWASGRRVCFNMGMRFAATLLLLAVLCSCQAAGEPAPASDAAAVYEQAGKYPVGTRSFYFTDAARGRTLTVQVWYPAAESARAAAETGFAVAEFVAPGPEREAFAAALAQAPANGPTRRAHAALDAPLSGDEAAWPLVLFSHCFECVRFSTFSIAERLASHGFVVAAPDHRGGSIWEHFAGVKTELSPEFLDVRAADMRALLDEALYAKAASWPAELRGKVDAARIGAYGHSFGGATVGLVLNQDPRVKAGLALAVPLANPVFPQTEMAKISVPTFYLLAVEDNSITEVGNDFIRDNFEAATAPAWKAEVRDAGHFSFADTCGVPEGFDAGCTVEDRQTFPGESFTYIDPALGREIAQAYTLAFFAAMLNGTPGAQTYLNSAHWPDWVSLAARNAP